MKKLLTVIIILALAGSLAAYLLTKNTNPNRSGNTPGTDYLSPAVMNFSIINTYPHDTSSFTQGLVWYKGSLYEGTGENGKSKLMKVDLKTGKAEKQISLDEKYFGEGITILRDTVYQLTWKNKVVFVYTLNDFKKIKEFPINTEGWGITTDGKSLIVSDGSNNLYFYEPSTFKLERTVGVTDAGSPAYNLNELEYINGYVYSNQWQLPYIFKIDVNSGQVVGKTDVTSLWERIKAQDPNADVPNGIAWDPETGKIYITGKNWPELYEIQFSK